MKTVHCVAVDPAGDAPEPLAWRWQFQAAVSLYLKRLQEPALGACRVSLFEIRVPEWLSKEEIGARVREAAVRAYRPVMRRDPLQPVAAEK